MSRNFWIFKSEPSEFSFEMLKARKDSGEVWSGVRNYQARNFMRDKMKDGNAVLFYHSSCEVPAIVDLAKVKDTGLVDMTQFDKKSKYYDEKSTKDKPRWICVSVVFEKDFKRILPLTEIKKNKAFNNLRLVQPGNRLSIMPVEKKDFDLIIALLS